MVQGRERILPLRAAGQATGARLPAARCHGERKNYFLSIFYFYPADATRVDTEPPLAGCYFERVDFSFLLTPVPYPRLDFARFRCEHTDILARKDWQG